MSINNRTQILFCLILFQGIGGKAQSGFPKAAPESVGLSTERLQELNSELHKIVDNGQLAGIQTAILRKGKLAHFDSYGFADIENKIALEENSIFRIFSMTKPIVSVALMKLYEEGRFQLDDPLYKYIPEFKYMQVYTQENGLQHAKTQIKIIDLLRHTSGLGYGRGDSDFINDLYFKAALTNSTDLQEFIKKLSELPLYFEPGTDWGYGHSTDVCGYLIEVLSGKPLDEFLNECIFEPLQMKDTHFELPKEKIARFTVGYRPGENGTLAIAERPSESIFSREVTLFRGGGGLVSTTADYLLFCQMLLNKGKLKDAVVLKPETIELMTKDHLEEVRKYQPKRLRLAPNTSGFGLGFAVEAYESNQDRGVYGWGGAVGTYFRIDPKNDLAYVMMIQLSPYRQLGLRERFQMLVNKVVISEY